MCKNHNFCSPLTLDADDRGDPVGMRNGVFIMRKLERRTTWRQKNFDDIFSSFSTMTECDCGLADGVAALCADTR